MIQMWAKQCQMENYSKGGETNAVGVKTIHHVSTVLVGEYTQPPLFT